MTMLTPEEVDQFTRAAAAFERAARTIDSMDRPAGGSGTATITVNAGGIGVWVSVTACVAMVGMLLIGSMWISRELTRMDTQAAEHEVKIDRSNTFLSAIWAQAPELEKQIKQESENAQRRDYNHHETESTSSSL